MINILSGNLNTYGNNGQFETDPSTWGFGSGGTRTIARNNFYYSADLNSMTCQVLTAGFSGFFSCAHAFVPIVSGKRYLAKAKVRVPTSSPPGEDNVVV